MIVAENPLQEPGAFSVLDLRDRGNGLPGIIVHRQSKIISISDSSDDDYESEGSHLGKLFLTIY
jgi:hypothetical protein